MAGMDPGTTGMLFVLLAGALAAMAAVIARLFQRIRSLSAREPEAVLAMRFAQGEIGEADYARQLAVLRMGPPLQVPD